jgi:integrase/recombinase XerD
MPEWIDFAAAYALAAPGVYARLGPTFPTEQTATPVPALYGPAPVLEQDDRAMRREMRLYLRHLDAIGRSAGTRESYQLGLEHFARWLDSRGIAEIVLVTRELIDEYLASLRAGDRPLGKNTIAHRAGTIRRFLAFLAERGLAPVGVIVPKIPKVRRKLARVLQAEEIRALLATCSRYALLDLRDRAIIEFMYSTGCRVGEVCALNLADLKFTAAGREERGEVLIRHGKGDRERVAYLLAPACRALHTYIDRGRRAVRGKYNEEALFVTREGRRCRRANVNYMLAERAKRAGIPVRPSSHWFRHSFATGLCDSGLDLPSLQAMLGHSDIKTTEVYLHVSQARVQAKHAQLHPRGHWPGPTASPVTPAGSDGGGSPEVDTSWLDWLGGG